MGNKSVGLTKKEILAIKEFKDLLLEKFHRRRINRIILFGSKARGDFRRSSDIDLLIVVTKNGKRVRREIAELTHEPILHFAVLLSPIIVEESFFEVWSPLLEHLKKDGITLWTNKGVKKNM